MAGYDDREDDRDRDRDRDRKDKDYDDDKYNHRDKERTLQKVKPPAIALLVSGILYVLGAIGGMVRTLLQRNEMLMQFEIQNAQARGAGMNPESMVGLVMIISAIVTLIAVVIGALIILGSVKMMNLQSRGLSMTACILGMLPCSICCLLSLPMGIWGLVTINSPEVKAMFR